MTTHNSSTAPKMNLHDLPVELGLQYSLADMNGPFGSVTAEERNDQATGSDIDMINGQQQTLSNESTSNNDQVPPLDDRLQTLYNTYHTSYTFNITKPSAHMQHAKDLALVLLRRHYPESQQYRVEPTALGPLSKYGINFELKAECEPDSDTDIPLSRKQKSGPKKDQRAFTDPIWHNIEPDNMAAFVVKEGVVEVIQGVETLAYRAHTYLVILLDNLSTFPRWSRDNENHRGDVLSDLCGVVGGIQSGHGMLFFGPRLELYSYDANDARKPVKPYANPSWRTDMRTTSLAEVDEVLGGFAGQEVVHKDGH